MAGEQENPQPQAQKVMPIPGESARAVVGLSEPPVALPGQAPTIVPSGPVASLAGIPIIPAPNPTGAAAPSGPLQAPKSPAEKPGLAKRFVGGVEGLFQAKGRPEWEQQMSGINSRIAATNPSDPSFPSLIMARRMLEEDRPRSPLGAFGTAFAQNLGAEFAPQAARAQEARQAESNREMQFAEEQPLRQAQAAEAAAGVPLKAAQTAATQAEVPLKGAQTAATQAEIPLRGAQTAATQAEVPLKEAQTKEVGEPKTAWQMFSRANQNPTPQQIVDFARELQKAPAAGKITLGDSVYRFDGGQVGERLGPAPVNYAMVAPGIAGGRAESDATKEWGDKVGAFETARANLANAKDGSQLAASLAPLQTALMVVSANGVHRINMTEVARSGDAGMGSLARRVDTQLKKYGNGALPPQTISEMSQLLEMYQRTQYRQYLSRVGAAAKTFGQSPDAVGVMNERGTETVSLRDALKHESAGAGLPAVGTVSRGYRFKGGDPSKRENWEKVQ